MKHANIAVLTAFLALLLVGAGEIQPQNKAARMTKEQLKPLLGSEDLVVIDIRLDEQWRFSNRKIPGAVHENPAVPSEWMDKYPKDKTIVFY